MANMNPNRVVRSLPNYSETDLERLVLAVKNEMNRRDKSLENTTMAISLPGTRPFETTEEEIKALQIRATELGIVTAEYQEWEIVQFGNVVADSRDNQWLDSWNKDMFPLFNYLLIANRMIAEITGYVIRTPSNLWKGKDSHKVFPFNETEVGNLTKLYTEISIIAERMGIPLDEPLPTLKALSVGIYSLINGHDTGESLRLVAQDFQGMSWGLETWLKNYKAPGRGISTAVERLCNRARPYRESGMGWESILDQIVSDLEQIHERTRLEEEEYEHTKTWSVEALKKAYGRRFTTVPAKS